MISPPWSLLSSEVFLRQEECTTTQLAQILPVTPSLISRVVTKMVNRGLMRRRRLRNDRRIVIADVDRGGEEPDAKASPARAGIRCNALRGHQ